MKDFFISYNSADKSWVEWIAWQLEKAGYTTVLMDWDSRPGTNFVTWMDETAREAERTIAVLSPEYLAAAFTQPEWHAAFRQDPTGKKGILLPIRIKECDQKGLLGNLTYIDLVGIDDPDKARELLLQKIKLQRAKPVSPPAFPVDSPHPVVAAPDYPGAKRNALKGLRPFGFEDAEMFQRLQRERELQACLTTLTDRDFRLGILFGESGCGKTSFVQAGLWPMLPRFSPTHQPLYVKFSEQDPLVTLRQAFKEQLQPPPPNIDNANFLQLCASAGQAPGKTLVLFFDQFEQFFVHFPQEEQRRPFVAALAEWYRHTPALNVKILLSLRHDYYAHQNELQQALGYSLGPQDNFELKKFSPKQATEIFQVIAETTALTFDRSFVEEMTTKELAGKDDGRISPVDIQILTWMISAQEEQGSLDRAAFQKMGGVEGLLENYLNRALAALPAKTEQQAALKIMLALVDLDNNVRAGVLTPEQIGEKLGAEVSAADRQRLIAWLAGAKVRLLTPLEREGVWGYELAHERLIQPLRRLTNKQLTEVDQANRLLERRVNEWLGNNRSNRYAFSLREMWTIRKQKHFLEWGKRKALKEELLKLSQLRVIRRNGAIFLFIIFLVWLNVGVDTSLIAIEGSYAKDVFASLYLHYGIPGSSSLGGIKLRNLSYDTLKSWIAFEENQYMFAQTADTLLLAPESIMEVPLRANFKPDILDAPSGRFGAKAKISYRHKRFGFVTEFSKTITVDFAIHQKNYMTWDDPRKAAAFITYDDIDVERFVGEALAYKSEILTGHWFSTAPIINALIIFDALRAYGVKTRPDPVIPFRSFGLRYSLDTIQYPSELLRKDSIYRAGDVDDLSVLYASLLQNVGVYTALVNVPMYLYVLFDTGIPERRKLMLPIPSNHFISRNNTLWIPVDACKIPNLSFVAAWQKAVDELENAGIDTITDIIDVTQAQAIYPTPRLNQASQWRPKIPDFTSELREDVSMLLAIPSRKE